MTDPNPTAVVLYGRAAFARDHALPALASRLEAVLRGPLARAPVLAAYADLTGPSLPEVLEGLPGRGIRRALVVPCMVPADPTLATWLPGALHHWRIASGEALAVRLAPAIETVLDLPSAILSVLDFPTQDVTTAAPSLGKPGWSKVPDHARQVFFCLGARCLHRGAEPLYQRLRARLRAHRDLSVGPRRVMCARCSCLYPCNRGPLMVVHPDGTWYGDLTPERLDRIVVEHLHADRPVAESLVHVTGAERG